MMQELEKNSSRKLRQQVQQFQPPPKQTSTNAITDKRLEKKSKIYVLQARDGFRSTGLVGTLRTSLPIWQIYWKGNARLNGYSLGSSRVETVDKITSVDEGKNSRPWLPSITKGNRGTPTRDRRHAIKTSHTAKQETMVLPNGIRDQTRRIHQILCRLYETKSSNSKGQIPTSKNRWPNG